MIIVSKGGYRIPVLRDSLTALSASLYSLQKHLHRFQGATVSQLRIFADMFAVKALLLVGLTTSLGAWAQLTGPVGPNTPLSQKTKVCNILDYGAKSDNKTNVAPALRDAFQKCVLPNKGSRLYVPEGNYLTTEDIVLSNATNWAFQLDGLITA